MQVKICLTCNKSKDILDFYKHRAKCKECMKSKRDENKDSIREYKKKYRLLNKDKINQYKKQYRQRNKIETGLCHAPKDCVYYLEGGPICPDCDPKGCLGVIPNTFIMCGEMNQYCSDECMRKANEKDTMR